MSLELFLATQSNVCSHTAPLTFSGSELPAANHAQSLEKLLESYISAGQACPICKLIRQCSL